MSSKNNQALVPTAVINESQWQQINSAIAPLNNDQLTWMSGYLAGLAHQQTGGQVVAPAATGAVVEKQLTILYGSQTGNAKGVAQDYKEKAEHAGLKVNLLSMADYKAKQLKSETHLLIVVSTHGEGDAPDDAVELHEFVGSKKAPKLPELNFAVVGLGDSSYEFFCQTAKDFDARLEALGAKRITPRVDCDVDYETVTNAFFDQIAIQLKEEFAASQAQVAPVAGAVVSTSGTASKSEYSKKNPFTATLLESQKITGRDSIKDIRHIEISLEESGIQYQPGDALGIWFTNDEALVDELLKLVAVDENETVVVGKDTLSVKQALIEKFELTLSYPTFVKSYLESAPNEKLQALFDDKAKLREYLADKQIVDIVTDFPAKISAEQLARALRPITPRLYSIASSQAEVDDEVHLTVAMVEYDVNGNVRQGSASNFLGKRLEEGQELKVFVEHNNNFRLPQNPETPVIMVGPGTGIAPFRAFMQQRAEDDAEGKNWLFFGNPSFTQDFLYQTEWQRFVKDGVVDKVSLAFSRDQEQKIYVQHRILENGAELFDWLEQGAHFYVCGDATHMAKDVHDALLTVVQEHGGKSEEDAEAYLTEMRRSKRYQKDVY
ncbi:MULTISPECIES: assimilatory sulfite reductase (NADPH) flavoprotein subunit [Alteromonadaceae]|uniref:assimilatory sulfite reductase (NADPH) flavoprotein subunit n=1 Tax=Alteromonadaceae TaxID=72275 RepID=UPI001C0876C9|nr:MULTISPECIES: assimilatory sulfite reductase (NADPH) flavoprotein subunit [Aliiglaciecola]MBU2878621.1 assimilatory sulfite reductase (NADPH) flavoprotein subunit [Aliiglaciecola lipolytica]MDO6709550.1 assimilatory sulfite reductase (NADPH) flavoprotein subunit [Aliiglaciecola sp. 2_MG-2023]MDO6750908.1 assimilatory sulfite reductase (NADPH) flavoprotein subunit [Aliiglaciecola sp. 1_MG-2023]